MTQRIDVTELTADMEGDYARFIASDPAAMIYFTVEFRAFLQQAVGGSPHYLVARNGSAIVGALPYFETTSGRFGSVINSLPWYGSHGGCQVDPAVPDARRALLAAYRDVIAAARISFSTAILTPAETAHLAQYTSACEPTTTDQRVGQVTMLPENGPDLEAALEAMCHQKTRNLIRKARKQDFELRSGDDDDGWAFLYETHVENMSAIGGRAKPLAHFHAMRSAIPMAWRRLLVVTRHAQPVAAMLLFRFNRTVEYITPVIKHEFRSLQPLSLAIWHGMIEAVRDGFRFWNWGGTWASQTTLHHFKSGWGAEDRPYSYLIHAKPEALAAWRSDRAAAIDAFPYYYLYPFEST